MLRDQLVVQCAQSPVIRVGKEPQIPHHHLNRRSFKQWRLVVDANRDLLFDQSITNQTQGRMVPGKNGNIPIIQRKRLRVRIGGKLDR